MSAAPPRACWPVLVRKAESNVETCRGRLSQADAAHRRLEATAQRLQQMMDEYRQRHAQAQQQETLMRDTLDQRQFISQLNQLAAKVAGDLARAQEQCRVERAALLVAEQERTKMQKLLEQQNGVWRAAQAKAEQRRSDEQAILRFQWQEG